MKVMKSLRVMQCAFMLFLIFLPFQLSAQRNIREGYVVTLQGDTLYGEIDFRTADMNMKQCVFKQKGADSFKTYLPGEIYSYRFTNNGIYYVSKKVDTDEGGSEIVFAEHVIRGSMNLYQVGGDEMLFEDEEGNIAKFSMEKANNVTKVRELHEEMDGVLHLLDKSTNAKNIIFKKNKNRDNTKAAVMAYVDEVCPDGYCEVFEYRKKKTPVEDRILYYCVKAGFKVTQYKFWNKETIVGCAPQLSVVFDFHINRLLNGLMGNVGLLLERGKASQDIAELAKDEESVRIVQGKPVDIDYKQLDVMFGPGYRFSCGPMKLRVKAGVIYRLLSHNFDYIKGVYHYRGPDCQNVIGEDTHWRFDSQIGWYGGVGLEYPMNKISLILDLDYIYDYNKWTVSANSSRTVVKQNGICLSAGVKF